MSRYLLIAGFGAAGAASRYAVDSRLSAITGGQFPWGTLTVNVVGAFLLGVLIAVTTERVLVDQNWRIGLGIGFLGSFTTFSTFSLESMNLLREGETMLAVLNAVGSSTACIVAAFGGHLIGRLIGG